MRGKLTYFTKSELHLTLNTTMAVVRGMSQTLAVTPSIYALDLHSRRFLLLL